MGAATANSCMDYLAQRLANPAQLTTDGLDAVAGAFGKAIDYTMLLKLYGADPEADKSPERKYSPSECLGARKEPITSNPDQKHISTSHVERHNLTMRMSMKRFGRLANAFSRKIDSHIAALSLYFVFCNFTPIHKARKLPLAKRGWRCGSALVDGGRCGDGRRAGAEARQARTIPATECRQPVNGS